MSDVLSSRSRLTFGLMGLLLLVMSMATFTSRGPSVVYRGVSEPAMTYLDESFDRALTGFGVLSALKAGLAVLEGSTGGVSAGVSIQLQVGDIVQTAYDYVDVAWRTLLFACLCLFSLQVLQDVIAWGLDPAVGLVLLLLSCSLLVRLLPRRSRSLEAILTDVSSLMIFVVLLLGVMFPLSLTLSSSLSNQITRDPLVEAGEGFATLRQDLFPEHEEESLFKRVRAVPDQLDRMGETLQERSRDVGRWTIQLIAAYLFDCLFFPLGAALLLGGGFRLFWRSFREERRFARVLLELRGLASQKPE